MPSQSAIMIRTLAFIAILAALYYFLGMIGILLSPLLALAFGWEYRNDPEVGVLAWIKRRAHESVHGQWQGRYYTFDERQIRFYLVDDTVWTAMEDVARILEPPPGERELRLLGDEHAPIPGSDVMACSETGLLRLLATRTEHRRASYHMIRFKNWIEKQAFPNVKRLPSSATALIHVGDTPAP